MMPFNRVDLSECQCDAILPGYRGAPIRLGFRSVFDSPDIGVITMHPVDGPRGTTVSLNTLNAPEKARDAFEKAGKELHKEKVDFKKVSKHLKKATEIYPEFAAAWQLLGQANLAVGDRDEARNSFQQALEADPDYVTPYISLAELEIQENHWEKSLQLTGQAIKLNPTVARAYYFRAIAHYYLQHDQQAEAAIRKVLRSESAADYPVSHYLLGGILGDRGEYEAAASEFRLFLQSRPHEKLVSEVEGRLKDWEDQGLIQPDGLAEQSTSKND
jgi:tetratricopeptide (TPR) repeat protein